MARSRTIGLNRRHGINRRQFIGAAGVFGGAVLLGSCGDDDTSTGSENGGEAGGDGPFQSNLSILHTGYDNPNFSHHMADVVAWEKGYLQEVGFTEFENIIINDSLAAILGEGVEWTAADTDQIVLNVIEHDQPITWLATRRDAEDMIFGLAPGVTLEELVAEKGFVSGGEIGTRNDLLGRMMLSELGLDPENDVEWVAMGGGSDTRLASLLNGDLMGSNIQIRHIATLEEAGGTVVYNEPRKIAQEGYVVQNSFLEENRDAVVAYLYAIIQAKQFIKDLDTKDEVIELLEGYDFEFPPEFVDAYESNVNNLSADGGFEIEEMQLLWDELAQSGEAPADIDWRSVLDLEPLWEAQEAAGLPRRPESL
jgi:ABC-type nitrate/sulfonate/bicarbonate transport system substrate-binding protein